VMSNTSSINGMIGIKILVAFEMIVNAFMQ